MTDKRATHVDGVDATGVCCGVAHDKRHNTQTQHRHIKERTGVASTHVTRVLYSSTHVMV